MCRKRSPKISRPDPELAKTLASWQRRRFLKQLAISLGGAGTLARNAGTLGLLQLLAPEYGIKKSFAGNRGRRRHLINLIGWGGWDSSWFHNTVALAPFEQAMATNSNIFISSNRTQGFEAGPAASKSIKFTRHYDDSQRMTFGKSYQGRPHVFGKGMKTLFENTSAPASVNDLLIWKGMIQQGQHTIGNFALNQGLSSSYAKSFSAVVSAHLADVDYPRKLHYISMAQTPAQLFTNFALAKGFEAPICIPDLATFAVLTRPASNVFSSSDEGRLANAIGRLANEALFPSLALPSSRDIASSYLISYTGATEVASSRWGDSLELRVSQLRYMHAILTALNDMAVPETVSVGSPLNFVGGKTYTTYIGDALAGLNTFYNDDLRAKISAFRLGQSNDLPALETQIKTILDSKAAAINAASGIAFSGKDIAGLDSQVSYVGSMAFYFGLTDFLIRKDISAVVDLPIGVGDEHYRWTRGYPTLVATFSAFKELITSLKEVPLDGGTTLFDQTTLVMHTELDRFQYLEPANNGPGTNHANTASVIMTGYGVQRGKVIGDISLGPLESSAFGAVPFGDALPVDPATGLPEPDPKKGTLLSVKSLFPTICAIFGAVIPAQQETEYKAVDAVIKKS